MNPQFFEHIFERLFRVGALDVWIQAATMKKGRPAQVLSVLCDDAAQENLISLLFSETSSLGVRTQRVNRLSLERKFVGVASPWGEVSVKVGFKGDQVMNVAPEYEDCRRIAREHDIPIKVVYDTVRALFKKA